MSHSISFPAYSVNEISERIHSIPDFRPTLGFIFSSKAIGIPELVSEISSLDIPVFGCSTAGEILPDVDSAPTLEYSAVCCFIDPEPSLFAHRLFERGSFSEDGLGRMIGNWGAETFENPGFIIAISGLTNNGEAILRGIEEVCPPGTAIFGAVAGDDGDFKETYVFTDKGCSTDGVSVIVFDLSQVTMDGVTSSGWTGVGVDMIITSSEGNRVYTINDKPAARVFRNYLNIRDEELVKVGLTFPLLLKRPDGSEVLRSFLSVDPQRGTLVFAGTVPEGSRVRFSSSFGYETIQNTVQELKQFQAEHAKADLILLFSCMARSQAAGPMVDDEVLAASQLWHAPFIGFFSYGEIGFNTFSACDFFNETLCLVRIIFPDHTR